MPSGQPARRRRYECRAGVPSGLPARRRRYKRGRSALGTTGETPAVRVRAGVPGTHTLLGLDSTGGNSEAVGLQQVRDCLAADEIQKLCRELLVL